MKRNLIFNPPPLRTVLYMPGLPGAGSIIYDRSLYGNHGTITGPTWVKNSQGLWGLNFDGTDDYVRITNNGSLEVGTGDFSIVAWIKAQTNVAFAQHHIYSRRSGNGAYFTIAQATGLLQFYGEGSLDFGAVTAATQNVMDNIWRCVGVIRTATAIEFLHNGASLGSQAKTYGDLTVTSDSWIGAEGIGDNLFKGQHALLRLVKSAIDVYQFNSWYQQTRSLFGV